MVIPPPDNSGFMVRQLCKGFFDCIMQLFRKQIIFYRLQVCRRCRAFLLFAYGCTAAVLHIKGQIKACAVVQRVGAGLVLPAVLAGHVAFMAVGQGALYLPPLGLYQPVCKRPGGWVVCLYPAHQRPAVQGTRFIRGNVTTV